METTQEKKLTLFKIEQDALALESLIYESGGEIGPAIESWLQEVETNLAVKVDGYAAVIDRMEYSEELMNEKASMFHAAATSFANVTKRLKERIKQSMIAMNTEEMVGDSFRFKLNNSAAKLVIDFEKLEEKYYVVETIVKKTPDNERIKNSLSEGFEVAGAELVPQKRLNKYTVKAKK